MPPTPEPAVFAYPDGPHLRRHGPRGYEDDSHYKPWLRDEFDYRCVYCLCREVWRSDGQAGFGCEHLHPRSMAAGGLTEYDTLAYSCSQCNSIRKAQPLPVDPSLGLAGHLEVMPDGTIRALTLVGAAFVRICGLDRQDLASYRGLILEILRYLSTEGNDEAGRLLCRYQAWPEDLPDLSALRPPGGNTRPEGVGRSAFARRQRGELPAVY